MISEDNYLIYCVLFPTHASFEPEFLPSVVQRALGALWLVYNASWGGRTWLEQGYWVEWWLQKAIEVMVVLTHKRRPKSRSLTSLKCKDLSRRPHEKRANMRRLNPRTPSLSQGSPFLLLASHKTPTCSPFFHLNPLSPDISPASILSPKTCCRVSNVLQSFFLHITPGGRDFFLYNLLCYPWLGGQQRIQK